MLTCSESYPQEKKQLGKVSLILPTYNEEQNIEHTLIEVDTTLKQICPDYEIVVVDDGSKDRTQQIIQKYIKNNCNVKVVGYNTNMGKGYALRKGFEFATGDKIVFFDSDSDIPHAELKLYLDTLEKVDVVIGSKRHPQSKVRASFKRRFLSASFHILVIMMLTGVKVTDTQAGLKAFRRSALEKIVRLMLVKGYAFDAELLAIASLLKMRIAELPISIDLTGKFRIQSILRMLIDLLGVAFKLKFRKWYQKNLNNGKPTYKPVIPI
ncbi:MAG: glycosyltransferase [Candidatus Bathyarchaeota archaeon]